MIRSILGALVIFTVAACSSNPQKPEPVAAADIDKTVAEAPAVAEKTAAKPRCKRVKPIGSHRTTLVCQTAEQAAAETRGTQDEMQRTQSTAPRVTVAPGG